MTPAPENQRQHRALKVVQLDAAALDRPCTRRGVVCGRRVLGDDHPDTPTSMNSVEETRRLLEDL